MIRKAEPVVGLSGQNGRIALQSLNDLRYGSRVADLPTMKGGSRQSYVIGLQALQRMPAG